LLYFEEPLLEFGFGQKLVYPRDGLFLFGPVGDTKQVSALRYGVIGTCDGVRRFHQWASVVGDFIDVPRRRVGSKAIEPHHVPFPGFREAFRAEWSEPSSVIADLDGREIERALRIANRHEAIRTAVDIFVNRLIGEHNRLENPPALWFVVIPEIVYRLGRPQSTVPKQDRIPGSVRISESRARQLGTEPTLFGVEEQEAEVYQYATHFRRQLKARLLKDRIVTQIVRETTLAPEEFKHDNGSLVRRVEDPATIAWKLCTATYYKAGGRPWQLADVRPGVCYVGLGYKRSELAKDIRSACCAAQMFLTDGDGVVFRGAIGPWFQRDSRQFHLSRVAARNLIEMVAREYERVHDGPPHELFLHGRSAFSDEEWAGFRDSCPSTTNLVGVQIADARDDLKLFRMGDYPVVRGTALPLGERGAYLFSTGYTPRLDTYMGPDTPNPVIVRVSRGDCSLNTVLADVLALTKVNFNSCLHNDRMPVTIQFANAVGDVLISAPVDSEPRLPFKFYI